MHRLFVVLAVLGGRAAAQPAPELAPAPAELQAPALVEAAQGSPTPIGLARTHASPQPRPDVPTPPTPLVLRELVARDRWGLSLATIAGLDELGLAIDVSGSIAFGDLELFGSAPLIGFFGLCIEGCLAGTAGEAALGNLRTGARYVHAFGPFTIAPSVSGWLPTQTAGGRWWPRARAVMTGASDSRAFATEAALGAAFDVAWRSTTTLVQAQLGVALVADNGPHVDNLFGALAASTQLTTQTSLLAEWRVDAYPHQPLIHAIGAGFGRGDPSRRVWRLRAHVVRTGELESTGHGVGAFELGFDLVQRL